MLGSIIKTESDISKTQPVSSKPGKIKRLEIMGRKLYAKNLYSIRNVGNKFYLDKALKSFSECKYEDEVLDTSSREIDDCKCSCDTFFKFGYCLHIAIIDAHLATSSRLVNRTVRRPTGLRRGTNRQGTMGSWRLSENVCGSQRSTRGRSKRKTTKNRTGTFS